MLIVVLVELLNIHVYSYFQSSINLIGDVMFGVLASSALDHMIKSRSGQTKYNKTGFDCFPACSTNEQEQKKKNKKKKSWLEIRITYQSGATCLPTDCCFSVLAP